MATLKEGVPSAPVVLVGVDFSQTSRFALETAGNLARAAPESELHLVHALTLPSAPHDAHELFSYAQSAFGGTLSKAREDLDRLAATATSGIDRVTAHLRIGRTAPSIVELALDIGSDLIVLGSRRHTGVSRIMLGSVAEKVMRNAPCPVLIARPKTIPAWRQIEPPCPDCVRVQVATEGNKLWCERHSQHRPRPHSYREMPGSYGIGAMTFRES